MKHNRSVPIALAAIGGLSVALLAWIPSSSANPAQPTSSIAGPVEPEQCQLTVFASAPKPARAWTPDRTPEEALTGLAQVLEDKAERVEESTQPAEQETELLIERADELRDAEVVERTTVGTTTAVVAETDGHDGEEGAQITITEVAPQDWRVTKEEYVVDMSNCS